MEQSLEISLSDWMKRKQETSSVDVITAPYGFPARVLAFTNLQNLSNGIVARSPCLSSNVNAGGGDQVHFCNKVQQHILEAERGEMTPHVTYV